MPDARRFLVSGWVQGVGYRAYARRAATELGLAGYARNLSDGRVEVVAQGPAASLAELEQRLRRGPSMARVEAVQAADVELEGNRPKTFEIQ
jgi:acylphosphatase